VEQRPVHKFDEGVVFLIDKPLTWTSFDVVRKIRNLVRTRKVGHAGTLDPLATGLLIVCTGRFTKRITEFMAQEKEYTGTFTLGATTPTYDLESEPVFTGDPSGISAEQLIQAAETFTGAIKQVPPAHSAIKKDGERAYALARRGEQIMLEPRNIVISSFEILSVAMPVVTFRVRCSTGTYIRSLAHDYGALLGCGAYLSSLCRTRIGTYCLDESMSMEQAQAQIRAYWENQNG